VTDAISIDSRRRVRTQRMVHRGVTYDSLPEVLFARALEERGVPFVAGASVWLGPGARPKVDFLVLFRGRALVIEIHGKAYHPAYRMAAEWNRTRPLLLHGVRVDFVEAVDVLEDAVAAVDRALELLAA
jgi:hypothetical protein